MKDLEKFHGGKIKPADEALYDFVRKHIKIAPDESNVRPCPQYIVARRAVATRSFTVLTQRRCSEVHPSVSVAASPSVGVCCAPVGSCRFSHTSSAAYPPVHVIRPG